MLRKGCKRNFITAAIGPCIRQGSYNVKDDFKKKFIKKDKKNKVFFKSEKDIIYFDFGPPPPSRFSQYNQSGPLSFEYFYDGEKIITNSGFGKDLNMC